MRASFLLTRSLRAVAPRALPRALPARSLTVSARRLAAEDPFAEDPRILDLRNKIQQHEGAKAAIMKLGEIMQNKGVDLTKPPSTMQVVKLGMDPEIREAGQNLMKQLAEAGVDINPETASQIFANVVKKDEGEK